MAGVLTAGAGQQWESDLVASLERPGSPLKVIRRCADISEVLVSAATGRARAAVVDASMRRLDTDTVHRLTTAGVAVVAVHQAGDSRSRERLERLGIVVLVSDDAGPAAVLAAARSAIDALERSAPASESPGLVSDPRRSLPPPPSGDALDGEPPAHSGGVVAVWGPTGAPGRSTVAAGLADAVAKTGQGTLLIDADVQGGVLASAFGVLDESAGLAGACRAAANGRLRAADLERLSWQISPSLRLLTGISRADRWPEIRPTAIGPVLDRAREIADLVVVDCGFSIEADEELSFDTMAPRRYGATLAMLSGADHVVAVGAADPPGMERLVRAIGDLRDVLPEVNPLVVLNKLRTSASTPRQAADALRRFSGIEPVGSLPFDLAATDAAWAAGTALTVAAPRSPLTAAFKTLAPRLLAALPAHR